MTLKLRARQTVKITNGKDFTYMLNQNRIYEFNPVDSATGKFSRNAQVMIEKLINLGYMEPIAQDLNAEIRDALPLTSENAINMMSSNVMFILR